MTTNTDQTLQAWTCTKCGAALPAAAGTGALVACGSCGTPFKLPTVQARGGAYIAGGVNVTGGSVFVGGDLIGGDLIVTTDGSAIRAGVPIARTQSAVGGIAIEADDFQVVGNIVGGSAVKIAPPAPPAKSEPVAVTQIELALDLSDEQLATPERIVEPVTSTPPMPKLGWREKVKRLFAN